MHSYIQSSSQAAYFFLPVSLMTHTCCKEKRGVVNTGHVTVYNAYIKVSEILVIVQSISHNKLIRNLKTCVCNMKHK